VDDVQQVNDSHLIVVGPTCHPRHSNHDGVAREERAILAPYVKRLSSREDDSEWLKWLLAGPRTQILVIQGTTSTCDNLLPVPLSGGLARTARESSLPLEPIQVLLRAQEQRAVGN
jgi:hypothetical protein